MAHAKPWTVGGVGATPSLDDVVSVASGHAIALDGAAAERIKKESPPPKLFEPEPVEPQTPGSSKAAATTAAAGSAAGFAAGGATDVVAGAAAAAAAAAGPGWPSCLSREQARAAIVTRLLSIMNGKSGVRLQLADFLKDLLNKDLLPALPAADDHAALTALADACKGLGHVIPPPQPAALPALPSSAADGGADAPAADAAVGGAQEQQEQQQEQAQQAFAAAVEAAGLSPPGISAGERCVLTSGAAVSAGVGALVIVAGRQLLSAVTAVAALSCEAAGAHVSFWRGHGVNVRWRVGPFLPGCCWWLRLRWLSCHEGAECRCLVSVVSTDTPLLSCHCCPPATHTPNRPSRLSWTWWRLRATRARLQQQMSCAACWRAAGQRAAAPLAAKRG
jgi:hypothetical protein